MTGLGSMAEAGRSKIWNDIRERVTSPVNGEGWERQERP